MTYEEVKSMIPAKRRWCRWVNCIYLQKYRGTIRVRYGYRYAYSNVVGIWYPNGTFKFLSMCYYPSQRIGLNRFMPDGYSIRTHRFFSFLWPLGEDLDDARAFYIRSPSRMNDHFIDTKGLKKWVVINGKKVRTKLGPTLKQVTEELRNEDRTRDLPRRRGRYWLRKARGVFRKPCGHPYPEPCEWRSMWPKPATAWTGKCGCEVYTKKAMSRDTVASIMDEPNATVRTSKIQIYGVEKFFTDAGAKTINKEAGYELLELNTGLAHQDSDRWGNRQQTANLVLAALRMECSTTGKVYVNTVPPQIRTVRAALDWMYDTDFYLERVGKQT
jgi:hypothetical protein